MGMGDRQEVQRELLERVLEVSGILRERRPDLVGSIIRNLDETAARLRQGELSKEDVDWIDRMVIQYLCHFKCLYDFCPLERLEGETEQAQWQRWGAILDRMREQAMRLCRSGRGSRRRGDNRI
jgi:hypothetical protein